MANKDRQRRKDQKKKPKAEKNQSKKQKNIADRINERAGS